MLRELEVLADEVRLAFHAFSEFARTSHGDVIDPSGRAVLEYLSKHDPASVPEMARARGVSRQHIQTIVNDLDSKGLVEASSNPAHKRSPLFDLSAAGSDLITAISRTERNLLEPVSDALDPARLVAAAATLTEVRELLAKVGGSAC